MRVDGRGSEVDIELIKQLSRHIREVNPTVESLQRNIEKKTSVEEANISSDELQKIIQEIRRKLDYLNRYLKIEIDQQLEIPVVKIFERDTNRLIKQIPPDYLLELMKRIDQMLGILLNERV